MSNIHKCDYCNAAVTNPYSVCVEASFNDEEGFSDEREWPYTLCPECFINWFEGCISMRRLVDVCTKNIRRGRKPQA